jgi:hypothetical protein
MWRRLTPFHLLLLAGAIGWPWANAALAGGSYIFALGITAFAIAALTLTR